MFPTTWRRRRRKKKTVAHCWRERRIFFLYEQPMYCVCRTHITHEDTMPQQKITIIQTVSLRQRACRAYFITYYVLSMVLSWHGIEQTNTHARGVSVRCGCYHYLSIRDYKHTMAHCVALIKSFLFEFWYAIFHHEQATYGQSPTQNTLQQTDWNNYDLLCVCVFFVRPIRRINLRIRQAYLSRTLSPLQPIVAAAPTFSSM